MPHATLRIEFNVNGKRKTVLVRAKRTQVTGQAFGQHGKHAIGQIHRCRTMASLKIDMPVPSHIVRNVSDMHTQLVATLGRALKRNGIVKVARVDRVDRDDKAVAQIAAERVLKRRGHIERKSLGLVQRGLGIAIGIAVTRHHVLNAQIGRVISANAAFDRHGARFQARRVGQNARDNGITRVDAQTIRRGILGQNEEVGLQARIERLDHTERTSGLVRTHHAYGCALNHAFDHGAPLTVRAVLNAHGNGIAIHDLALTAAHNLVVAALGYDIGAMLMELHAPGQARTAFAAHRPTLIASTALMLVIAPHGASLLSMTNSKESTQMIRFPAVP